MIRRMELEDIAAVMRLKQAAGWNQTEQDWANLLALEPEGCWVYETEGQVVGSTTAVCYGQRLAWIGMVLVLPECRGRGYARELMEHALAFLHQRGVRAVRLDATDMGKPLYASLGFQEESSIERWAAVALDKPPAPAPLQPLENVAEVATLDRRAFGADRARVLQRLAEGFRDECLQAPAGYAMARPGTEAHFLGPCVAQDAATARRLIGTLLGPHGGRNAFWDLLPDNREALRYAQELGFQCKRRLVRMALGDAAHLGATRGEAALQFATAGFEYG
jgi:ribosomal protein S18 acetylase RimI-like enzyme